VCFCPLALSHDKSRFTNKAVVLPAADSDSKPIYIPAGTKFVVHIESSVTVY
jgi:hypothetical protein